MAAAVNTSHSLILISVIYILNWAHLMNISFCLLYFFSSKNFHLIHYLIWFFSGTRLSVSLLRLLTFSFVSFVIVHWSIFMMATLKYLSGNFICVILIWCLVIVFSHFKLSLSYFLVWLIVLIESEYCGYYVMRLWVLFLVGFFWYCTSWSCLLCLCLCLCQVWMEVQVVHVASLTPCNFTLPLKSFQQGNRTFHYSWGSMGI